MDIYRLNDEMRAIADAAGACLSDDEFDDLVWVVAKALGIESE